MKALLFITMFAILTSACAKSPTVARYAPQIDKGLPYKLIHFATGGDGILKSERGSLGENALWLKENPEAYVVLEGHCDERGSHRYNMELGDRRARSVKAGLIESGLDPARVVMIVSYGKTRPLDKGHTSNAWAVNRRVEFILR